MLTTHFKFLLFVLVLSVCIPTDAQNNWIMLSAGTEFGMGIRDNGSLHSWGYNQNGQLGNGQISGAFSFQNYRVSSDIKWDFISCGGVHAAGIKEDGTLWAWGNNGVKQINAASTPDFSTPQKIGTSSDWKFVDCGQGHTLALNQSGQLFSWGFNVGVQLGNGNKTNNGTPALVESDLPWLLVSAGGAHSLGIKSDSTLWAWGLNFTGQVGNATQTDALIPVRIGNPAIKWKSVSAGYEYSIAIDSEGKLYSWGFNGNGQLGNGNTPSTNIPVMINEGPWSQISAGSVFVTGIMSDGTIHGWGANLRGVLNDAGLSTNILFPTVLDDSDSWETVVSSEGLGNGQSVFGFNFYAMNEEGSAFCASGANYVGQLNTGDLEDREGMDCDAGVIMVATYEVNNDHSLFAIYPNPVHTSLNVNISEIESFETFEVYTIEGKPLISGKIDNVSFEVDCSMLSSGMYILKSTNGLKSSHRTFIKY